MTFEEILDQRRTIQITPAWMFPIRSVERAYRDRRAL
jgi:hypothetical protein